MVTAEEAVPRLLRRVLPLDRLDPAPVPRGARARRHAQGRRDVDEDPRAAKGPARGRHRDLRRGLQRHRGVRAPLRRRERVLPRAPGAAPALEPAARPIDSESRELGLYYA